MKRLVVLITLLAILGASIIVYHPVQEDSRTIMQFAVETNTTANNSANSTENNTTISGGAGFLSNPMTFIQRHLGSTVLAAIVLVLGVLMIVHNRFSTILGILLFLGGTVYLLYTLGYLNSLAGMLPGV